MWLTGFIWHSRVIPSPYVPYTSDHDAFSWKCRDLNAFQLRSTLNFTLDWFLYRQAIGGFAREGGLDFGPYPFDDAIGPDFRVSHGYEGYPKCCPADKFGNFKCQGGGNAGIYGAPITSPDYADYRTNGPTAGCDWDSYR